MVSQTIYRRNENKLKRIDSIPGWMDGCSKREYRIERDMKRRDQNGEGERGTKYMIREKEKRIRKSVQEKKKEKSPKCMNIEKMAG